MVVRDACPACGSNRYKKNGHTRHGKQNYQCQACDRQFVATAENPLIAHEQRTLIEHLPRERISLHGACRAGGVSLTWLLHCMVEGVAACPDHLPAQLPAGPAEVVLHQVDAAADARWSVGEKQANTPWLGLAIDATTPQSMAFQVGARRRDRAKARWPKLPAVYREQATWHTGQDEADHGVMPAARPRAITKKARQTHHRERCNTPLRQRVCRPVRAPLSFPKNLAHHLGAIKQFMCHDHRMRTTA